MTDTPARSESESGGGNLRCFCGFTGSWREITTHECSEDDPGTFVTQAEPPAPQWGRDPADWPDSGVTY